MKNKLYVFLIVFILLSANIYGADATTIKIFERAMVQFSPDSTASKNNNDITTFDNGRIIQKTIAIPEYNQNQKITAVLNIYPIPKDALSVCDPWDRAGNVSLVIGEQKIEMIKFITAYGGHTEYTVDLSHLIQPLTEPKITVQAFIDTWSSPGWEIDFELTYEPTDDTIAPVWITPVMFINSYTAEKYGDKGYEQKVSIPDNIKRVQLYYLVSGHCTDGRDADEFISKDNLISVDDQIVYRYQPWRDDCKQFRDINPYTKKWSAGYWSSDFSRSGWCPGDMVEPLILDLSDHLKPGEHSINVKVEDVRPKDENDQYGYWRISAYLVGWDQWDIYKYNEDL